MPTSHYILTQLEPPYDPDETILDTPPRPPLHDRTARTWQHESLRSSLLDLLRLPSTAASSQANASVQLQLQRCFDASSRALARLAIVSRSNEVEETEGHLTPSLSVMNVDADRDGSYSMSGEVLLGRSVYGRGARTLCLWEGTDEGSCIAHSKESSNLERLVFDSAQLAAGVCYNALRGDSVVDEVVKQFFRWDSPSSTAPNDAFGIPPNLLESALEFLATAFACLESDLVHSMLLLPLTLDRREFNLFHVLCALSPPNQCRDSKGRITTIAFLALSRGLEATRHVARYSASLDPSISCGAYCSPHSIVGTVPCGGWIDEGGCGWVSGLGKNLGLHLESSRGVRLARINEIARYARDFILEFPSESGEEVQQCIEASSRRGGIGRMGSDLQWCQTLVARDRIFAAHVDFLSSMIHIGVVSGWLTPETSSEESDAPCSKRTVDGLCETLFFVIESRSRLCRSANRIVNKCDPGDVEAVVSGSLSLLLLVLPKHQDPTLSSTLSFTQMGGNVGTIDDIFQSPLVKRIVELGLTFSSDTEYQKDHETLTKFNTIAAAINVMSDILIVGGASLLSSSFGPQMNHLIQEIVKFICHYASCRSIGHPSSAFIEAILGFSLHLHTECPALLRLALRDCFEESSIFHTSDNTDSAVESFVGNLVRLGAHKSYPVSACASSLLRSLLNYGPDVLSETMKQSFESDFVGTSLESALHTLVETSSLFVVGTSSSYSLRYFPRICTIGDMLGACSSSSRFLRIFSSTLFTPLRDTTAMDVFVGVIKSERVGVDDVGNLMSSAILSLLYLLCSCPFNENNEGDESIGCNKHHREIEVIWGASLMAIESAMAQGSSVDVSLRAMKLLTFLPSSKRTVALTFTRNQSFKLRHEESMRVTIDNANSEIRELNAKLESKEAEREKMNTALLDQRTSYEKRIQYAKYEAQSTGQRAIDIHVKERRRAEQKCFFSERRCSEEKVLRKSTEEINTRISEESVRFKLEVNSGIARIGELEKRVEEETRSRLQCVSALEASKRELSSNEEELESAVRKSSELQSKLANAEKTLANVTATNLELELRLEETCGKLVSLACIFQSKEAENEKHKSELRSVVNSANANADTAMAKYEASRKEAKSLKNEFEAAVSELTELKAHRAEVQRQRKNAPISYINQLRTDPRLQTQARKSRSGKENLLNRSLKNDYICKYP